MTPAQRIADLLDALESMCFQYLGDRRNLELLHSYMSAGEQACATLAKYYPNRWRLTGRGAQYIGPLDADGWPVGHSWGR